ncbi:MAG: glycoside hydrolase family 5 protein [Lachnospiraceae bacterium]|nr:glycoside hydrolase family 5 protein [Lachnospiraceae bacterium]
MKKKLIDILIGVMVIVSVCGCTTQNTVSNRENHNKQEQQTALETEQYIEPEETKEKIVEEKTIEENTKNEEENKEVVEDEIMIDRSATFQLLEDMRIGWNLGNTLDAHINGQTATVSSETCWGNPVTTPEMMQAIAAQGFKTVRVPVTWSLHMTDKPEYKIDEAWLDRVEEIVNYALDADLYVILDTHHEPDYWLKPQSEGLEDVKNQLTAIWKQVGERFRDYDKRLVFEGMNEPRMKGSEKEWSGGDTDGRAAVNVLNRAFVDTVRATGGNNETRCLIICPYGNSVTYNSIIELEIPQDNNIMVAVHLYTPYFFTYEQEQNNICEWDGSLKKDIISAMSLVDKYLIQKDVPVIITEFGAVNKEYTDVNGNRVSNREEVLKWLADYMEVANKYGMTCVWWDNGIYDASGEKFAIFDRNKMSWYDKEIADALIMHAAK